MLALYDFIPSYCPHCGKELHIAADQCALYDWQHKNSFLCGCGLRYLRVDTDNALDAADASGSDTKYARRALGL